jgi:hypothetical protein
MAIYVKFAEKEKPKTVREFLHKFFSCYGADYLKNVTTYRNKECTHIQCEAGKYRSFDDVFELVKTYYPTVSIGRIFKIMLTLNPTTTYSNSKFRLHMMSCAGINKINCLYVTFSSDKSRNYNNIITQSQYKSKVTYKELFKMIGVNNQEDLNKILKV